MLPGDSIQQISGYCRACGKQTDGHEPDFAIHQMPEDWLGQAIHFCSRRGIVVKGQEDDRVRW